MYQKWKTRIYQNFGLELLLIFFFFHSLSIAVSTRVRSHEGSTGVDGSSGGNNGLLTLSVAELLALFGGHLLGHIHTLLLRDIHASLINKKIPTKLLSYTRRVATSFILP